MSRHYSDEAEMRWPVTGEAFTGVEGIVAVNRLYPEGWSIEVLAVDPLIDGRVVSRVRVKHPPNEFFAVTFFTIVDGLIDYVEEYWSTVEPSESWRNASAIPGWSKYALPS